MPVCEVEHRKVLSLSESIEQLVNSWHGVGIKFLDGFDSLKSIQNWHDPSGFGTSTIGLCHSLVEGFITPSLNMDQTPSFTGACRWHGGDLVLVPATSPGRVSEV